MAEVGDFEKEEVSIEAKFEYRKMIKGSSKKTKVDKKSNQKLSTKDQKISEQTVNPNEPLLDKQ